MNDMDEWLDETSDEETFAAAPVDAPPVVEALPDIETDDFDNPSFSAVDRGKELWSTVTGSEGKSCATCHDKAEDTMKGVRASMPKWDKDLGKPITLD